MSVRMSYEKHVSDQSMAHTLLHPFIYFFSDQFMSYEKHMGHITHTHIHILRTHILHSHITRTHILTVPHMIPSQ